MAPGRDSGANAVGHTGDQSGGRPPVERPRTRGQRETADRSDVSLQGDLDALEQLVLDQIRDFIDKLAEVEARSRGSPARPCERRSQLDYDVA